MTPEKPAGYTFYNSTQDGRNDETETRNVRSGLSNYPGGNVEPAVPPEIRDPRDSSSTLNAHGSGFAANVPGSVTSAIGVGV